MLGLGFGWSNFFALPFAVSVDVDDEGDRWVAFHIGPFFVDFAVEWR